MPTVGGSGTGSGAGTGSAGPGGVSASGVRHLHIFQQIRKAIHCIRLFRLVSQVRRTADLVLAPEVEQRPSTPIPVKQRRPVKVTETALENEPALESALADSVAYLCHIVIDNYTFNCCITLLL